MSGHISRYMKIFFPAIISSIGGILIFLSDLIGNLRIKKNPDLYLDIQFIGLIFFIVGVIIYIFIAEFKELKEEESKPLLTIKNITQNINMLLGQKGKIGKKSENGILPL